MNFEWDESKSEDCSRQRGFDFAYAARAFFDSNRIVYADTRRSYGEERYQLMGMIEQRLFVPASRNHAHHLGSQSESTRGKTL